MIRGDAGLCCRSERVIGLRLVPLLVEAGHEVAGMTRSPRKRERLRGLGAEPVVCDAFDAAALCEAVVAFAPEAVVNELTDLPDEPAVKNEANARMRRLGTRNLLAAAEAAGASRFVARSIALAAAGRRRCGGRRARTACAPVEKPEPRIFSLYIAADCRGD
jgi:nucleoside-diphosphate-sugar epimerase